VNPSVPEGGPSASPERPGEPSREAEDQRLMERVVSRHNMIQAYERVKSNAGAPGVDGMTVEELMPYLREHWAGIRDDLLGDGYRPQPVRRAEIPKRVLRLIRRYLQSGVMINGVVVSTEEGTPQGGPLSPLLANILLDDLDCELQSRGHRFVRYADDVNVYVKSKRAGERVLESLK